MRLACRMAYPDRNHHMRFHELSIVAHSNRFTAACCLKNRGATDEEIAFRLRWHVASVPTYLREYFDGVNTIMARAIARATRSLTCLLILS
jgi:hypothetical protein